MPEDSNIDTNFLWLAHIIMITTVFVVSLWYCRLGLLLIKIKDSKIDEPYNLLTGYEKWLSAT